MQLILSRALQDAASDNGDDLVEETNLGGFTSSTLTLKTTLKEDKWPYRA